MRAKESVVKEYALKFESVDLSTEDEVRQHVMNKYFEFTKSNFVHTWPSYVTGKVKNVRFMSESTEYNEIIPIIDNIQIMGESNIKVGQLLSLMYLDVVFATRDIEVSGFTTPKKVTNINVSPNGLIKQIVFEDGTRWPQVKPATFKGKPLDYTIFFKEDEAATALTYLLTAKPNNWEINISDLKENTNESDSYQPPLSTKEIQS